MIAITLSEDEARAVLAALDAPHDDDPCERCGHGGLTHSAAGPLRSRPCYAGDGCCPCTGYVQPDGPPALRVAIKRRIRAALDARDATIAAVRAEESPSYRQHMRDAGRGGMLR